VLFKQRLSDHKLVITLLRITVHYSLDVSSAVVIELNIEFREDHDLIEVEVVVKVVVQCVLEESDVPPADVDTEGLAVVSQESHSVKVVGLEALLEVLL